MQGASIQLNSQAAAQDAKNAAAQDQAQHQNAQPRNIQTKATGTTFSVTYNKGVATTSSSAAVGRGTNAPIQQVATQDRSTTDSNVVVAKSSGGRALSGNEINGNSVVEIGGMKTTLRAATAAGLVAQNANGVHEYTAKGRSFDSGTATQKPAAAKPQSPRQSPQQPTPQAAEQQQPEQQQEQTPTMVPLDQTGEEALSVLNAGVPSGVLRAGVQESIVNGGVSPEAIATAAKAMGVSNEEAGKTIRAFEQSLVTQANNHVGPQAQAIWDHARATDPAGLREAMSRHVNQGDLSGYSAIADSYIQNLDTINPGMILNSADAAKVNPRVESNGRISIEVNGKRLLWSAHVRTAKNRPYFK